MQAYMSILKHNKDFACIKNCVDVSFHLEEKKRLDASVYSKCFWEQGRPRFLQKKKDYMFNKNYKQFSKVPLVLVHENVFLK